MAHISVTFDFFYSLLYQTIHKTTMIILYILLTALKKIIPNRLKFENLPQWDAGFAIGRSNSVKCKM